MTLPGDRGFQPCGNPPVGVVVPGRLGKIVPASSLPCSQDGCPPLCAVVHRPVSLLVITIKIYLFVTAIGFCCHYLIGT
jgi:hypothetical protein